MLKYAPFAITEFNECTNVVGCLTSPFDGRQFQYAANIIFKNVFARILRTLTVIDPSLVIATFKVL